MDRDEKVPRLEEYKRLIGLWKQTRDPAVRSLIHSRRDSWRRSA